MVDGVSSNYTRQKAENLKIVHTHEPISGWPHSRPFVLSDLMIMTLRRSTVMSMVSNIKALRLITRREAGLTSSRVRQCKPAAYGDSDVTERGEGQ